MNVIRKKITKSFSPNKNFNLKYWNILIWKSLQLLYFFVEIVIFVVKAVCQIWHEIEEKNFIDTNLYFSYMKCIWKKSVTRPVK